MTVRREFDEEQEVQEKPSDSGETSRDAQPSLETIKAMQHERISEGHLVPATVIEGLDTIVDEKKAQEIAETQYPNKTIDELPDNNLRGVAYEGQVQRDLEDKHGAEHVRTHPEGLTLKDGRSISPDFAITDDNGNIIALHDAKGYTRKETKKPDAAASSLTHMSNLEHASRYTEVNDPNVTSVSFDMPRETADMRAVQDNVAELGNEDRTVSVDSVGSEADLNQRMTDLRTEPHERFVLASEVRNEIERIRALPPEERREAMGNFVLSLQDSKGNQTNEGRNIRFATQVERGGNGVTITDNQTGEKYTIWYS